MDNDTILVKIYILLQNDIFREAINLINYILSSLITKAS